MAAVTGEVLIGGRPLKFSTRALVAFEAKFGGRAAHLIVGDASITVIVAALEAGCGISEDEACDLVDRVGIPAAAEAMADAMKAAFPEAVEGDASPQKAASTG